MDAEKKEQKMRQSSDVLGTTKCRCNTDDALVSCVSDYL